MLEFTSFKALFSSVGSFILILKHTIVARKLNTRFRYSGIFLPLLPLK